MLKLRRPVPRGVAGLIGGTVVLLGAIISFLLFYPDLEEAWIRHGVSQPNALGQWRDQLDGTVLTRSQLQLLEQGELEVFTLYPYLMPPPEPDSEKERVEFHGFLSLGSTMAAPGEEREQLLTGLYMSIVKDELMANCFFPRHGLRAVSEEGRVLDLVICFECSRIDVYEDEYLNTIGVAGAGRAIFNDYLTARGLTITP